MAESLKIETNIEDILDLMDRPAFCVDGGVIRAANDAARSRMLSPGENVFPLIRTGAREYEAFSSGCLYLTLCIGDETCGASVTRLGDQDVFTLEKSDGDLTLKAYALAAQELRQPLSQLLAVSDQLFPALEDPENGSTAEQIARMNRSLHQLLRLVGNMSDAATAGAARMELRDVTAVVQEIIDHATPLCQSAQVTLSFENHPVPVYSLLDSQKLERAIYNLLSNSLKHMSPGGEIAVQLKRRVNTLYLTVTDSGDSARSGLSAGMFSRFLREPGMTDGRSGLGLGLTLVRAAAAAHHGALLLDQTSSGGVRATLSFPIQQDSGSLRSPSLHIDYAGERDHGLIELSESLPYQLYRSRND